MILKIHHENEFTIVDNRLIRDNNLSLRSIGLLVKLLSLPDNGDFSEAGLAAICKDGVTSVRSGLHELEKFGYLKRTKVYENGRIADIQYDVYEVPKA